MKDHPAAATLARLRKRRAATEEPLERAELNRKIRAVANRAARREYLAKSAVVLRDLAGAYR